jgi:hypothetical protein
VNTELHRVEVEIDAAPEHVYELLAAVTRMGEWSSECIRCRWLGSARDEPGARFRGTSRNGRRTWSTTSTITMAEPGRAFAFAVTYLRLPVATWRYDLHANGRGGTVLAESVEDHRGALLRTVSPFITGSRDRNERNDATMRTTLERLKAAAESA